jgi:hypothetical protein
MNANTHDEQGDFSLEQVEDRLRALSAVEPPYSLKDRLIADVIGVSAGLTGQHVRFWSRETRWVGAAAAVIVAASIVGWLGAPFGRQVRPPRDTSDSASHPTSWARAADHNNLRATDTNSCEPNGPR